MNKKEEKIGELKNEFNRIQEESKSIDINKYLAKREDLPDLGDIQIYDYDKDIEDSNNQSIEILGSLVDLYLGDSPEVSGHSYIKNKMQEDAQVYAEMIFLQKMTRKNFLTQLRGVDNGDNSARMFEVINQSISEIRENIKFSQSQKTSLEKFYKDIRKDFGLNEISEAKENESKLTNPGLSEADGKIVDSKNLNDMIDKYIKGK